MKFKSYFDNFYIVLVGIGYGLLGLETPKSAVSQEWIDGMGSFFSYWYKFKKAKSFEKNLVRERWVKILSANQVTGFLNKLNQNDEKAWFLHFDTDS